MALKSSSTKWIITNNNPNHYVSELKLETWYWRGYCFFKNYTAHIFSIILSNIQTSKPLQGASFLTVIASYDFIIAARVKKFNFYEDLGYFFNRFEILYRVKLFSNFSVAKSLSSEEEWTDDDLLVIESHQETWWWHGCGCLNCVSCFYVSSGRVSA